MRLIKTRLLLIIIIFIFPLYLFSVTTGFDFLNLSPSPAVSSLGDAGSSYYFNTASFYYNPALLSESSSKKLIYPVNIYCSYSDYFQQFQYFNLFSIISFFNNKKLGIGVTGLFSNDIEKTVYQDNVYAVVGNYHVGFYNFLVGYAQTIYQDISLGINLKLPIEVLESKSYIGLGGDIGTHYQKNNWSISFVIRNLGQDLISGQETHMLPLCFVLGGYYQFYLFKKRYQKEHKILMLSDVGRTIEKRNILGIGLSYIYKDMISLRNGYSFENSKLHLRLGCGFQISRFHVDYSYLWGDINNTHKIGLEMKIGARRDRIKMKPIKIKKINVGSMIPLPEKDYDLFLNETVVFNNYAYKTLNQIIDILEKDKNREVYIYSYYHETTDADKAIQISRNRVQAVYYYLIKKGVSENRLYYKALKNRPLSSMSQDIEYKKKITGIEIIIIKVETDEKDKFSYYYYNGMDYYIKEDYKRAVQEWQKAVYFDPANQEIKKWIKKAKIQLKKEEK